MSDWGKRFNAYGALAVTAAIFALYAFTPADDTLKSLAILAAGYWLGSSNSSQKKDDTLAGAAAALATSTPVPTPNPSDTAEAENAAELLRNKLVGAAQP